MYPGLLITIHKNDVCSRQKYPETWQCLHNSISFSTFKYGLTFKIHPASSKWKPISISMNLCFANGRSSFQKNKTYAWRHQKLSNVRLRDSRKVATLKMKLWINKKIYKWNSWRKWKMTTIWRPLPWQKCNQQIWNLWNILYHHI